MTAQFAQANVELLKNCPAGQLIEEVETQVDCLVKPFVVVPEIHGVHEVEPEFEYVFTAQSAHANVELLKNCPAGQLIEDEETQADKDVLPESPFVVVPEGQFVQLLEYSPDEFE